MCECVARWRVIKGINRCFCILCTVYCSQLVPFSNDGYSSNRQPVRLLYDLSFFIIVTTIGLNIVFGIIIDTFGELREERVSSEYFQTIHYYFYNITYIYLIYYSDHLFIVTYFA